MKTPIENPKHSLITISLLVVLMLVNLAGRNLPGAHAETTASSSDSGIAVSVSPEEARLFELINEARQNPLETAVSLGLDRQQVLADNPEITDVLKDGLPPLNFNQILYQSAQRHAAAMLNNNFYSYESIDGTKVARRMENMGYLPALAGESLGLIFFNNYIDPLKSATLMFNNMFKDELALDFGSPRRILNPKVRDMAVAVNKGDYEFPRFSANVYMAACDFARPVEVYELQFMNLINQLRSNPRPVLAEYGIDADVALFPELGRLFLEGLPPLSYQANLYAAADELVADMFEKEHFLPVTSGGKTLDERVRGNGYQPAWIEEARVRLSNCAVLSPAEASSRLFKILLARAFRNDPQKRRQSMLSDKAEDAGIRIKAGSSSVLGGVCGDDLYLMVGDFGAKRRAEDFDDAAEIDAHPEKGDTNCLVGLVYDDSDVNGIYDAGEELPEARVIVDQGPGSEVRGEVLTNAAGGYQMTLPPGDYRVIVGVGEARISKWIRIQEGANTWYPTVLRRPEQEGGM